MSTYFTPELAYKAYVGDIFLMHTDIHSCDFGHHSNQVWAVTSAVGAGLCFLVLVVIAALYTHRGSRIHLNRVSFRLMLYSLVAK